MPANLTPDYLKAEEEFKKAKIQHEKLSALRKMLATIPKHKGTDKLQADIKRRIARLKDEIQQQKKKKGFSISVQKEGAAQITVIGPPNSGKSKLISKLSGVDLEVAEHPFSTHKPFSAMMKFEDIQIQLVDLPPISNIHLEFWVPNIVRISDATLLVVDLADPEILDRIEETISILKDYKIKIVRYLVDNDPWASIVEKTTWMIGNKFDLRNAKENWEVITELYSGKYGLSAVSCTTDQNIEKLRLDIFQMLHILRVYSKRPHSETDFLKPFVLKQGSTLLDFATLVHHDFSEKLKFARIWGHGKFDGQRVNKDYILQDKDIVELHM